MKKKIAVILILALFVLALCASTINATEGTQEPIETIDVTQTPDSTQGTQGTVPETGESSQEADTSTGNSSNTADLKNDSTVNLVQMRDRELETLQDYQESYGDNTYGLVAYILNIIRIYSIPFGFVGIAISGIYRYIIGIRKLDVRDKGFGAMIGIITVMVICQILPLVFAIVVRGWRG